MRRLFRLPPSRSRLLREMDDEMRFHLEMRIAELQAKGLGAAEAEREALRRFGGDDEFRDSSTGHAIHRARRYAIIEWVAEWTQDVRFAARLFVRAPGFTLIAVLTLALGIGANTAIFSVVHHLLLAPLPYPNGNRIVMPVRKSSGDLQGLSSVSGAIAQAWRDDGRTAEAVGAATEDLFSARPDGSLDSLPVAEVTANFLTMLGVRPVVGRGFVPTDEPVRDAPGTVALIGYELWQRGYGGRVDVLGQRVGHEGQPLTIVGVLPPGLRIPLSPNGPPAIWVPLPLRRAAGGGSGATPGPASVFATLRPGVALDAATRELQHIARLTPSDEGESHPSRPGAPDSVEQVRVARAQDFLDPHEARAVQMLFAAVGALLLIACANVANLLLMRAWTRQRELAVRSALGAGRARLVRQVLTESVLLALAGGVLGVVVAWQTLGIIIALRPPALDHLADVRLEPVVLVWTLAISVGTGILFGCAPALLAGTRSAGDVLRRETRGGSAGRSATRLRAGLIVLEIAVSLLLLVGSGLLVQSFRALQRMRLGYEPQKLVFVEALLGDRRSRDRRLALRGAVEQRLRTLPGVTDLAFGVMPGKEWGVFGGIEAEIEPGGATTRVPRLKMTLMSPGYFRVARIALLEGRLPDTTSLPMTGIGGEVLVNRALAHRLSPGGHVIGVRLREASEGMAPGAPAPSWNRIVGVVDDTRMPGLTGDVATFQMYRPLTLQFGDVGYMVRTSMSGDVAAPVIKRAVASVDPVIYVRAVLSGDTYLRESLAPTRFAMALLTAFACIALLLSAVGLYGVIAYGVAQRTREIGVRVAMGAAPRAVAGMVVGDALRLAAAGVVIGVVAAIASTRLLTSLLYDVSPVDPSTYVLIAILVIAIALLASYVPVRRALRIDAAEALGAD